MAQQRLGIIMNGVTGRMGTNQHLIRSIVAIRDAGRRRARERRPGDARSDPGRPQRRASSRQLAKAHGIARWTTDLDAALKNKDDTLFFDAATTQLRAELLQAGDRRRQAHLLREAGRRDARRTRSIWCAPRSKARHQARRGAGQAVPAGPAQAQDADRLRLLRPHPLGARRVRLLGVRGRLAAGAAAVVELPEGGRRRHHPRHALPLALRARQPVRRGEERDAASARRTSRSAGTRTASPTTPTSTTPPTRRSSSRAA